MHSFETEVVESMLQEKPSRTRGNAQEIETGYVVGADIGGTSLRLALAGMDGNVLAMWKVSTAGEVEVLREDEASEGVAASSVGIESAMTS